MRKIKDVLRLHFEAGLQRRLIARAVGTSHTTVGDYLKRATRAGLSWPLPGSQKMPGFSGAINPILGGAIRAVSDRW